MAPRTEDHVDRHAKDGGLSSGMVRVRTSVNRLEEAEEKSFWGEPLSMWLIRGRKRLPIPSASLLRASP
jgi:hypothetical protein